MRHIEFPEANKSFNIPENLSECTGKDYMEMSRLIMAYYAGKITYEEFRILAVKHWLNIKLKENDDEEVLANIYMLSELMDGFFENSENNKKIILDYIDIKIPKIRTITKTYFGPQDSFSDMTYGEYTDAVKVFLQFSNSGEVALLYDLAGILYRRKKRGKRMPYDSTDIEKRSKTFKKYTSFGFVAGVYLQFAAFLQYLPEASLSLDGKSELDFSILYEGSAGETPEKVPGIGADAVVFTLAESGIFGKVKDVRSTPFWEIQIALYELRRKDIENQKQQDAKNKPTA